MIHQDFSAGIPIQISVYRDKLYISNDCVFPDTWTAETLLKKHRSLPHNPDIANTFFRAGFIESWGRGIEKICTLCKNYGIPEPEYTVHPGDIMLMFSASIAENVTETTQKTTQKITQKTTQKIMELIKNYPEITQKELAEKSGITPDGVRWQIKKLKNNGSIRRVGPDKGGHWEVVLNSAKD